MLKRKIYSDLLEWKKKSKGKVAILIEGVKGVGKTTIAREFGEKEYESYLLIDFSKTTKKIRDIFSDGFMDPDFFFSQLSIATDVRFYVRNTLIIFDEVQEFPLARSFIKYLVEDGRYDYIETGSLISIINNTRNILIPSEERILPLNPLDFEEYLWAMGNTLTYEYVRQRYASLLPVGINHLGTMKKFKEYMIVGGMPQAVEEYSINRNFESVEAIKREILKFHKDDILKLSKRKSEKILKMYNQIPIILNQPNKKFSFSRLGLNARTRDYEISFQWLQEAGLINQFYSTRVLGKDDGFNFEIKKRKVYLSDTGLLITLAIEENVLDPKEVYNSILFDKLKINGGMIVENIVTQMLVASGQIKSFYHSIDFEDPRKYIELDFLVIQGTKKCPLELRSSENKDHSTLNKIRGKFDQELGRSYIAYDKDLLIKDGIVYLPLYMIPLL